MKSFFFFLIFLKFVWSQGTWTQIVSSPYPQILNRQTAIYASGSMIIFGGFGSITSSISYPLNYLWMYDIGSNSWNLASPYGTPPPARQSHSAIYVPNSNSMIVYGGNVYYKVFFGDMFIYSLSNNNWNQLVPLSSSPSARSDHSAIYYPIDNLMLIYGGSNGSTFGDLWQYDITNNAWTQLNPSSSPGLRSSHSAIFHPNSKSMIIYGGYDAGALGDIWQYYIVNNTWIQIYPSGSTPSARYSHTAIYNPNCDCMFIFGGYDGTNSFNDLWEYNIVLQSWDQIFPSGSIPLARDAQSAIYSPVSDSMLIYAGYNNGAILNDFWRYSFAKFTTQQETTQMLQTTQLSTTQTQTSTTQTQTTLQPTTGLTDISKSNFSTKIKSSSLQILFILFYFIF